MQRLILDARALVMMATKLPGPMEFAPEGGQQGVFQLIDEDEDSEGKWQPNNLAARRLVLAIEPAGRIVRLVNGLDASNRKHTLADLTLPVCLLVEAMPLLRNALKDPRLDKERLTWRKKERDLYVDIPRRIGKLTEKHPIKLMRNKLIAHLDSNAIGDRSLKLTADELLPTMRDVLIWYVVVLNHKSAFHWGRLAGPGTKEDTRFVETILQFPALMRWEADADGKVIDADCSFAGADPRASVIQRFLDACHAHNTLCEAFGGKHEPIGVTTRRQDGEGEPQPEEVLLVAFGEPPKPADASGAGNKTKKKRKRR